MYIYICAFVCIFILCIFICVNLNNVMFKYVSVYIYIFIYLYVCMYVCMYVCIVGGNEPTWSTLSGNLYHPTFPWSNDQMGAPKERPNNSQRSMIVNDYIFGPHLVWLLTCFRSSSSHYELPVLEHLEVGPWFGYFWHLLTFLFPVSFWNRQLMSTPPLPTGHVTIPWCYPLVN